MPSESPDILPDLAMLLGKRIDTPRSELMQEVTKRENERSALRGKVAEFEDWGQRLRRAMGASGSAAYNTEPFMEGPMTDNHWRVLHNLLVHGAERRAELGQAIDRLNAELATLRRK